MLTLTVRVTTMNQIPMRAKNNSNTLAAREYEDVLTLLGKLLNTYYVKQANVQAKGKIDQHLTWIASLNVLSVVDATTLYNKSTEVANDVDLFRFYTQLDFHLFSIGTDRYPDSYIRLCNNIARALPRANKDVYGINYQKDNGDLYELAKKLYNKDFIDYITKPSREKVLRYFLLNHRHVVLQLLIMQFYQLKLAN